MTTILVEPDGGERIHWPQQGHDFILKIASESVGSFSLTEAVIPPGKGAGCTFMKRLRSVGTYSTVSTASQWVTPSSLLDQARRS